MGVRYGTDDEQNVIEELSFCTIKHNFMKYSFEMSMLLFFLLPMTVITILYVLIGIKLYKGGNVAHPVTQNPILISVSEGDTNQQQSIQPDSLYNFNHSKSTRRVVKMLGKKMECIVRYHCISSYVTILQSILINQLILLW